MPKTQITLGKGTSRSGSRSKCWAQLMSRVYRGSSGHGRFQCLACTPLLLFFLVFDLVFGLSPIFSSAQPNRSSAQSLFLGWAAKRDKQSWTTLFHLSCGADKLSYESTTTLSCDSDSRVSLRLVSPRLAQVPFRPRPLSLPSRHRRGFLESHLNQTSAWTSALLS